MVRQLLTDHCRASTAHLLNNVTLEHEDGSTQIDHILLTQNGIFIIETKDYTGWIFGSEKQSQWTQKIFKKTYRFQNPLHQNYKHLIVVQGLLDFLPKTHFKSLVVFTSKSEFKTQLPSNVIHLPDLPKSINESSPTAISQDELQRCVGRLECKRFELTNKTDVEHRQYLDTKFGEIDE